MISDCISLSDKLARPVPTFVSEDGAVDAGLSAVVDELSPNKHGVSVTGSEDDFFARTRKDFLPSAICIPTARVVPLVEFEAGGVAILSQIPNRV